MTSVWTDINRRDTGNGAIIWAAESASHPGVRQIRFRSYCGRESDRTWYEALGDPERREYSTAGKAAERYEQVNRQSAAERELSRLRDDLARRGIRY